MLAKMLSSNEKKKKKKKKLIGWTQLYSINVKVKEFAQMLCRFKSSKTYEANDTRILYMHFHFRQHCL
jgi:hypothetical protein